MVFRFVFLFVFIVSGSLGFRFADGVELFSVEVCSWFRFVWGPMFVYSLVLIRVKFVKGLGLLWSQILFSGFGFPVCCTFTV